MGCAIAFESMFLARQKQVLGGNERIAKSEIQDERSNSGEPEAIGKIPEDE
jgi:hypothetical protein